MRVNENYRVVGSLSSLLPNIQQKCLLVWSYITYYTAELQKRQPWICIDDQINETNAATAEKIIVITCIMKYLSMVIIHLINENHCNHALGWGKLFNYALWKCEKNYNKVIDWIDWFAARKLAGKVKGSLRYDCHYSPSPCGVSVSFVLPNTSKQSAIVCV